MLLRLSTNTACRLLSPLRELQVRLFHAPCCLLGPKPLPPRPQLLDEDVTEKFLKGTGPGGQKINKTSSAVQLIHHPTGIVIKCQETRSRTQNRKIARQHLAEKLEYMEKGDESRIAQKAERAKKKKASKTKKSRRKYRLLAEDKAASADAETHDGEGERAEEAEDDEDETKLMSDEEHCLPHPPAGGHNVTTQEATATTPTKPA